MARDGNICEEAGALFVPLEERGLERTFCRDHQDNWGEGDTTAGLLDARQDRGLGIKGLAKEADRLQTNAQRFGQGGRYGCHSMLQEQACPTGVHFGWVS